LEEPVPDGAAAFDHLSVNAKQQSFAHIDRAPLAGFHESVGLLGLLMSTQT
jgi:hypothetical protein